VAVLSSAGTFVIAFLGCLAGVFAMLPFGLVVTGWVVFPLALALGGLLGALGASWMATLLSHDGSRTRLLPVVLATEVAVVVTALLLVGSLALGTNVGPGVQAVPAIVLGAAGSLVPALVATLAAGRLRSSDRVFEADVRLTLVLLALAVVGVPAVFLLASAAGLTGA
jgi:hypothetical protein